MKNLTRKLPRWFAAVPLLALVLAGCGSSSSSSSSSGNGVGSKNPTQILEATKTAASSATSVHIAGSIVSGGKPISLNMELVAGKGGKGTIAQEGFSIDLIQVGDSVYINGSEDFYAHFAGAEAAQLLKGKWLKAPAGSGDLASLSELTNLSKLVDAALANHGTLAKGKEATVAGQKVIGVDDTSKGGTLYVATTGSPYPIEIEKTGKEGGKVTFDHWNKPVTLTAPSDSIDITKLQSGQ